MNIKVAFKRILRRSSMMRKIYYYLKLIVIFPLRFTSLKTIASSTKFPLKDLLNFPKISLLKIVAPYTQVGYPRLTNVYNLANDIEKGGIEGAFVECGVWKGGCAATMAAVAQRYGSRRKIWYFDSFEGMPEPTKEDGSGSRRLIGEVNKASIFEVEELIFKKLNLSRSKNILIKGWFEDTLPKMKEKVGKIAILRIDGDWYKSTLTCLNQLYNQVVSGGYIIIDDYGTWPGCRQAVHEFLNANNIKADFKFIGGHDPLLSKKLPPVYFQKS